jgi:hypothetical protein
MEMRSSIRIAHGNSRIKANTELSMALGAGKSLGCQMEKVGGG